MVSLETSVPDDGGLETSVPVGGLDGGQLSTSDGGLETSVPEMVVWWSRDISTGDGGLVSTSDGGLETSVPEMVV